MALPLVEVWAWLQLGGWKADQTQMANTGEYGTSGTSCTSMAAACPYSMAEHGRRIAVSARETHKWDDSANA